MKMAMKNIYLIMALSLSAVSVDAQELNSLKDNANTRNALGTYKCLRTDPANNTKSYSLIVRKVGATYAFEWSDSKGDSALYGTGVISPNVPYFIASSFWDPYKPELVGVEVFEIKPDGTLQGNWVLQAENEIGSETCIKNKP
jgi:hypothetical protein